MTKLCLFAHLLKIKKLVKILFHQQTNINIIKATLLKKSQDDVLAFIASFHYVPIFIKI